MPEQRWTEFVNSVLLLLYRRNTYHSHKDGKDYKEKNYQTIEPNPGCYTDGQLHDWSAVYLTWIVDNALSDSLLKVLSASFHVTQVGYILVAYQLHWL